MHDGPIEDPVEDFLVIQRSMACARSKALELMLEAWSDDCDYQEILERPYRINDTDIPYNVNTTTKMYVWGASTVEVLSFRPSLPHYRDHRSKFSDSEIVHRDTHIHLLDGRRKGS